MNWLTNKVLHFPLELTNLIKFSQKEKRKEKKKTWLMTADTYWQDHGKSPSNTSIGNQMVARTN